MYSELSASPFLLHKSFSTHNCIRDWCGADQDTYFAEIVYPKMKIYKQKYTVFMHMVTYEAIRSYASLLEFSLCMGVVPY